MTLPADCARGYRVLSRIGEGAYGEVFRAIQLGLDRTVALKVLHAVRSADDAEVQRFLAEAKITSALAHPGIVIVIEWGHGAGVPWIAYEYLPGPTLAALAAGGPLDPARVVTAGVQLAHALHHAHERGVLHRDVKPENVIEVEPDRYKIGDFGIAKWSGAAQVHTRTGIVIGSPAYIAPELIAGQPASARSDVYALAISLYELLAGRQPFEGSNLMEVLQGHLTGAPRPLDAAAPALAAVVARGMARDPGARYATAAELARALEQVQRGETDLSATQSRPVRRPRPSGTARAAATTALGTTQAARAAWPRVLGAALAALLAAGALCVLAVRFASRRLPGLAAPVAIGAVSLPAPGVVELSLTGALPERLDARLPLPAAPGRVGRTLDGALDRAAARVRFTGVPAGTLSTATVDAGSVALSAAVRTPPPWHLRDPELLSSADAVQVYFQYATSAPGSVQVRDGHGALAATAAFPPDGHMFLATLPGLSPDHDYRVIIDPGAAWGPVVELPVRTQVTPALGEFSVDVERREGGHHLLDGPTDSILRGFAKGRLGQDTLALMMSLGKSMRTAEKLIELERRLVPPSAMLETIHDVRGVDGDDAYCAQAYLRLVHDARVAEALDRRFSTADPALRLSLLPAFLATRWPGALARAEAALARDDKLGRDLSGPALTLVGRALPPGPESAEKLAARIEAQAHTRDRTVAQTLIDLDRDVARRRFRDWTGRRGDLVLLATQGLALLGEDADVAAIEGVLTRAPAGPFLRPAALRRLADVGTPAARAALDRALRTAPLHPLALWGAARLGLSESQDVIAAALGSPDEMARLAAAVALGNLGDARAVPALTAALAHGTPAVRRNAAWALGQLAVKPAPAELRAWALSEEDETGVGAWALSRIGDTRSGDDLVNLLGRLAAQPPGTPAILRAAVVGYALRLMAYAPARAALDAAAKAPGKEFLRLCVAPALPGAVPGATVVALFPFVFEQRTGVYLEPGQVVQARVVGTYQSGTGNGRTANETVQVTTPVEFITAGLELEQQVYTLARAPRPFVAVHAQEITLTTVPEVDLHDFSPAAGAALRGLRFVELDVRPAPPAR